MRHAGVEAGGSFNVMKEGSIWVKVEEDVDAGDLAYVRFAANGGNTQQGGFRKSVDAGTARLTQFIVTYVNSKT